MDLRATLQQLATTFAASVLEAIRNTSLEQLLSEAGGTPTRPAKKPRAPAAAPKAPARPTVKKAAAKKSAAKSDGRQMRRTPDDIAKTIETIVALLKEHKDGLRSEQIRAALGLTAKEMPRPLLDGLAAKAFKKKGQKRATTYFL